MTEIQNAANDSFVSRTVRIISRALLLRCPRCGSRGFMTSWLKPAKKCPTCGFEPTRYDEGLVMGAYAFNLVLAEFVAMGAVIGFVIVNWPEPNWTVAMIVGLTLAVLLPLLFYPFSRTLFTGLLLVFGV